jgi:hypothetical protein
MKLTLWRALIIVAVVSTLFTILPVAANPPAPEDANLPPPPVEPVDGHKIGGVKPIPRPM